MASIVDKEGHSVEKDSVAALGREADNDRITHSAVRETSRTDVG